MLYSWGVKPAKSEFWFWIYKPFLKWSFSVLTDHVCNAKMPCRKANFSDEWLWVKWKKENASVAGIESGSLALWNLLPHFDMVKTVSTQMTTKEPVMRKLHVQLCHCKTEGCMIFCISSFFSYCVLLCALVHAVICSIVCCDAFFSNKCCELWVSCVVHFYFMPIPCFVHVISASCLRCDAFFFQVMDTICY